MDRVTTSEKRPPSILVVEDDQAIAEVIASALGDEGMDVRVAPSAEHALEHLTHFAPAVILVDYRMPGMSGHEFIGAYHALNVAHAPIIFSTANIGSEQSAIDLGAADVLLKPFEIDDLIDVVRRHLPADSADA